MYMKKIYPDYRIVNSIIRLYSLARKTHYEILNLRKNCTEKEIKEAFIKMSKEYHPDKNKDARAQENFVKIVEAYNVLGKSNSRAQYDSMTEFELKTGSSHAYKAPYGPYYHVKRDPPQYTYYYQSFYKNQSNNQSADDQKEQFYGGTGIKKQPNYIIVLLCFGVAFVSVVLQSLAIWQTHSMQRHNDIERTKYLGKELEKVRTAAAENGNDLQTKLLLEKIVSSSNPSVTTASLGQALANEKK